MLTLKLNQSQNLLWRQNQSGISWNFLQSKPNPNHQDKDREAVEACCSTEWKDYMHTFPLWLQRKASLFQVSFCFGIEPSSLQPPPPGSPCHPDRVRHCGKVQYKSSGPGGDAWPQIRPAHCLSASMSSPQGSRLADNCTATGRKSLHPSVCVCVCVR